MYSVTDGQRDRQTDVGPKDDFMMPRLPRADQTACSTIGYK